MRRRTSFVAQRTNLRSLAARVKSSRAHARPVTAGYAGTHACEDNAQASSEAALSGSRKVGRTFVGRNRLGAEPLRESPSIARSAWVERMSTRRDGGPTPQHR